MYTHQLGDMFFDTTNHLKALAHIALPASRGMEANRLKELFY